MALDDTDDTDDTDDKDDKDAMDTITVGGVTAPVSTAVVLVTPFDL